MKRCPSCDKTFEDSMRFCQVDGTALVDDAPAFDPYATIVGAPMVKPPAVPEPESVPEPVIHEAEGSKAVAPPEDVLDLPEADPLKTMYVSDAEMLAALGRDKPAAEPEIIEIPPIEDEPTPADVEMSPVETADEKEEVPSPEPPSFSVPDVPSPSFHDFGPPPSPFSTSGGGDDAPVPPPTFDPPKPPPVFNEAETMIQPSFSSPFDDPPSPPPAAAWAPPPAPDPVKSPFDPSPAAPVAEWTPPPAPEPSWQNKDIGANTPFQPPPAGVEGDSKGLAIGSLVTGILSCLCCVSVITGPAAIVMGFIAKKKADEDPKQYGGRGLALGGMITGALGFVIGVALIILQLFFGVLSSLAR